MSKPVRKKGKKNRKYTRNAAKCARYRALIGKPRGPGKPGCKSGAKWMARQHQPVVPFSHEKP